MTKMRWAEICGDCRRVFQAQGTDVPWPPEGPELGRGLCGWSGVGEGGGGEAKRSNGT